MFTRVTSYNPLRVSVVIPTLNEAENLPHVLPYIPEWVDEIIIVDGRSTDNTVEVARQLWPSIQVIQQVGRGKGAALRQGFSAATGDIIVMMDADGSTNPLEIPAFIAILVAGADFVKGSRFLKEVAQKILRRSGKSATGDCYSSSGRFLAANILIFVMASMHFGRNT